MVKKSTTKKSTNRSAKKAATKEEKCVSTCKSMSCSSSSSCCVYILGFIGALVYYIQHATGFWNGVLGVLKALVWPAMLVFKLLGM